MFKFLLISVFAGLLSDVAEAAGPNLVLPSTTPSDAATANSAPPPDTLGDAERLQMIRSQQYQWLRDEAVRVEAERRRFEETRQKE